MMRLAIVAQLTKAKKVALTDFDRGFAGFVVAMLAGRAMAHATTAAYRAHLLRRSRGGRALALD